MKKRLGTPPPRAAEVLLAALACLLVAAWTSSWAIGQDFWTIDDPTYLRIVRDAGRGFREAGLRGWWTGLFPPGENNFGPVTALHAFLTIKAFGLASPLPYHVVKGAMHGLFLFGVWAAARQLGAGRAGAFAAAFLAEASSLTSILPDIQSYQANWMRLYTTDSFTAPWLALWWALAARAGLSRRPVAWALAAAVALALGVLAKASAIVYVGGAGVAVAAAWWGRRRRASPARAALLAAGVVALGIIALRVYGVGGGGVEIRRYEGASLFDRDETLRGLLFYAYFVLESSLWMPVLAAGAAWLAARATLRGDGRLARATAWRHGLVLALVATALAGWVLQSGWPIRLPRYALVFHPPLCIAMGVGMGAMLRWMRRQQGVGRLLAVAAVGAGFLGTLGLYAPSFNALHKAAPAVALGLGVLAWAAWRTRRARPVLAAAGWVLAGIALFQGGVLALNWLEARACFVVHYAGGNQVKAQVRALARPGEALPLFSEVNPDETHTNLLWWMNEVEGLALQPTTPGMPDDSVAPPYLVHLQADPHPLAASGWIPQGNAGGRHVLDHEVEPAPGDVVLLAPGESIPLGELRGASMIVARFNTGTLGWTREARVQAGASLRGDATPRLATDEVPLALDPPTSGPASLAHEAVTGPLGFLQSRHLRLAVLGDGNGRAAHRAYRVEPWADGAPTRHVTGTVERRAWHVDAPFAVLRTMAKQPRHAWSAQHLRPVVYRSTSTLVRVDAE